MPLAKETLVLGVDDAKIAELTVDTSATLTYGSLVDVPGIQEINVSPNFIEKELKGDEATLDHYVKLDNIDWSFQNAKISLDALAILEGGTVVASGVTPAQKQTYTLLSTDKPKYFKLEGKSNYTDVGDAHIILYKCKANKVDVGFKGEDYAIVSASGKAIGTVKDKKVKDIVLNETAADIT
ncbi:MAG: hypothetical protein RDU41_08815 [Clostridia bacterium]|nr:hypothetical protein [Clostridia bacterium]